MCLVVEDEDHALFHCHAHTFIRLKHHSLLCRLNTLNLMLNPQSSEDVVKVGVYITEIEKNMQELKMCS